MPERTVCTSVPLHARPLDRFVRAARTFESSVRLLHGEKQADGENVVQLLLLAVPAGAEVTLQVDGPDADAAMEELARLLALGEETAAPPPAPAAGPDEAAAGLIQGVAGAPGVGTGIARRERPNHRPHAAASVEEERERLRRALLTADRVTSAIVDEDDPFSDIFQAQQSLLADEALTADLERAVDGGAAAEDAVLDTFAEIERRFDALGDRFAAERHADVADVRDRLLDALDRRQDDPGAAAEGPLVHVLEEATPSRMATLDLQQVTAVISSRGGPTSHAAIVARGRGLPLVFADPACLRGIADGQWLRVDGDGGTIEPLPARTEIDLTERRRQQLTRAERPLRLVPGATLDGQRVALRVNLGAPGELPLARRLGAEGCGLLRTELLFAGRREAPGVEEQARAYDRVARALAPHPVIVRLFDAGSDKPLPFMPVEPEPNPALGVRGVRLLLRHRSVLADQLAAVRLARQQGGLDLRVMVPMVTEAAQLDAVRGMVPGDLPVGAMVETPAAALLARALAPRSAFLSIGSNDLAQYTLAADRGAAARHTLHPAVLRLVARTVDAARAASVECGVCGELAGDPRTAALLVGLGVRSLSMAPPRLAEVRAELGARDLPELEALARTALKLDDPGELDRLLAGE